MRMEYLTLCCKTLIIINSDWIKQGQETKELKPNQGRAGNAKSNYFVFNGLDLYV